MSNALTSWISSQIIKLLGFDEGDEEHATDLAEYINSMNEEIDVRSYVLDLVDDPVKAEAFVKSLMSKRKAEARRNARQEGTSSAAAEASSATSASTPSFEPLPSLEPMPALDKPVEAVALGKSVPSESMKPSGQASTSAAKPTEQVPSALNAPTSQPIRLTSKPKTRTSAAPPKRPKQKFISFMDRQSGNLVAELLPGRRFCECLASKHTLINNCLQCGRIVCEQEGIGPCMHCGACVVTPEQQQLLARNSKQAKKFLEKLMRDTGVSDNMSLEMFRRTALQSYNSSSPEALALANSRRDQLLDYDRNMAKRTHVIDDQSDYYNTDSNKWQSRKERDAARQREQDLREQQREARRTTKITIDFAGRRVVEEEPDMVDIYEKERLRQEAEREQQRLATVRGPVVQAEAVVEEETVAQSLQDNPMLDDQAVKPVFQLDTALAHASEGHKPSSAASRGRIQDKGLNEMTDQGLCMSMHQPWASLLVYGIKMHEGRVWSSSHRGRLWIAAASKVPSQEDLDQLEEHYRQYYASLDVPFPREYPTACLLGYIDVDDILPQDEYREKYPDGDSSMPFVFVCKNPHELVVRYPVKGDHKIWKLDRDMHESAKKCVVPVNMDWLPEGQKST